MITIAAYGDGINTHAYILLNSLIVLGNTIAQTGIEGVRFCSQTGVINTAELFVFLSRLFHQIPL